MFYVPESLSKLFELRRENEIRLYTYLVHPNNLKSTETLYQADLRAAEQIKEAEKLIQLLQEYRQALFDRSRKVSAAVFSPVLKFWRKKNYCTKKVTYHLMICLRCSDPSISEKETFSESFSGAQRREAFRRFEELKRTHPGISVEQHTEKERWE